MQPAKLIAMANQIARFFHAYPPDEASASVRKHLVAFWTPAMRRTLEAHLAEDHAGVDPLVVAAMHRADTAGNIIGRTADPEREAGVMATDAG